MFTIEDERQKIFNELWVILSSYVPTPLCKNRCEQTIRYLRNKTCTDRQDKEERDVLCFHHYTEISRWIIFLAHITHKDRFDDAPEELLHLLKGKSCFHIKRFYTAVFENIRQVMDKGIRIYEEEGWV